MTALQPGTENAPAVALGCPHCTTALAPKAEPQACPSCGKEVVLRAGCLLDRSLVPPPFEAKEIKVTGSGLLTRTRSVVGRESIRSGDLDPVTGRIPIGENQVPWNDIWSITTWRRPDYAVLIATVVLLLPFDVLLALGAVESPYMLLFALPFWAWTFFAVRKAFKTGVRYMRVCGSRLILTFRYDTWTGKWRRFEAEAMKRAGLPAKQEPS